MDVNVIRWKLNELMARKRIRNKDLAAALGITENSVYRLRRIDEMPRLSPDRLNGICAVLKCQPGELLEWVPDDDGDQNVIAESTSKPSNKTEKSSSNQDTKRRKNTRSLLSVISKAVKPALDVQPGDFIVYTPDDEVA